MGKLGPPPGLTAAFRQTIPLVEPFLFKSFWGLFACQTRCKLISAATFMATILQALDIRPTKKYRVRGGRPVPIVEGGAEPLKELFS